MGVPPPIDASGCANNGNAVAAPPPHMLLFPFRTQGHLNPFLDLAHRLCAAGVAATLLLTPAVSAAVRSPSPRPLLRFRTLDLPPHVHSLLPAGAPLHLIFQTVDADLAAPLRSFLQAAALELSQQDGGGGRPPFSCIVFDSFMPWVIDVATEIGVPTVDFWTSSAFSYLLGFYTPKFVQCRLLPFVPGTEETPINFIDERIPGTLRLHDLSFSMLCAEGPKSPFFRFLSRGFARGAESRMVLVNSVLELEEWAVDAMRVHNVFLTPIAAVPPPPLPSDSNSTGNLMGKEEDRSCLLWLDQQLPGTVVYIAFGSAVSLSDTDTEEIAAALADSELPFLWALCGNCAPPEGLRRGYITTGWVPQCEILSHAAVGAFVTHCGWNSTMEALLRGVVMVGCPREAEQSINLWLAKQLGMAMEGVDRVGADVGKSKRGPLLRALKAVTGDAKMRQRAAELGGATRHAASSPSGSASKGFGRFIQEVVCA